MSKLNLQYIKADGTVDATQPQFLFDLGDIDLGQADPAQLIVKLQQTVDANGKVIYVVATGVPAGGGGGGNYAGNYGSGTSYAAGTIARSLSGVLTLGTQQYYVQPGVYGCVFPTLGYPSAGWNQNMLPQYPEPTNGIVYWHLLNFLPVFVNVCSNGSRQIYIQASGSF